MSDGKPSLRSQKPLLSFLAAWASINLVLNLRYPGSEPKLWYLIPSLDTVWLFPLLALIAWSGRRVPRALLVAIVALLVLARIVRFGDGVQSAYYAQRFSLYTDLPLAPELVRFAYSTLPWWKFWPLTAAVVAGMAGVLVLLYRALRIVEGFLRDRRQFWIFAGVAAASFVIGLFVPHDPRRAELLRGGLGESVMPRLQHEALFLINVSKYRRARGDAIARTEAEILKSPRNLVKLGRADVHLILIESYGETVVERPDYRRTIAPVFETTTSELGALGFSIASGLLDSSTYGGRSWLAHATLGSGVRTPDQLQYDLVLASKSKPMASFFNDAGYRTVLVQPGTTRPWPKGEFYRFEKKYYAWDFDYVGPAFAWATMPDQYILDFVRRRELAGAHPPVFIQYVLVTSHAPWSDLPTVVQDWSAIGNGAIYETHPARRFPIEWPNFSNASQAYIESIVYDFEVLKRYIASFIGDGSLVILIGDHQPVYDVNGGTSSRRVPVHVLSRNAALVAPFRARGYADGMWPGGRSRGMETFLVDFLRDFSTAP